ncbi:MAG: adenylate/guanylate cyclase domain-containing protein, partial [Acidimicrobiia bacterium]
MPQPPSGNVTFLFTDIEGSTQLWESAPEAMRPALERHDVLLRAAIDTRRGYLVKATGDGVHAAFDHADDALAAAIAIQDALSVESWPDGATVRVRMGVHTGEASERDGDYFGPEVNHAARLMAVAHGGQVLCSQATAALVDAEVTLLDQGEHRLRDLDRPLRVFQVGEGTFGPLRSQDAGNLPLAVTSFVGRHEDMARVVQALAASPVVT